LNHGQTKLTAGALRTSSESDTFGEQNNKAWDELTGSETTPDKLESIWGKLGSKKDSYNNFRNRFLTGYGMKGLGSDKFTADPKPGTVDDSLLLLYYQRQYGNN
jgi:hypothetical protein